MSRWARSGVRRYDQTIKSFDWRIGREEYRRSLFSDQSEHCWCCGRCYITSEQWIQVTVHCSVISIQCPYWVLSEAAAPSLEKPQQPQDGVLLVLLLLRWQGQGGDRAERLRVRPLHRAGDHARIPGEYWILAWVLDAMEVTISVVLVLSFFLAIKIPCLSFSLGLIVLFVLRS